VAKWHVPSAVVSKVFAGYDKDGTVITRDKPVAYRVDHTGNHVNWNNSKSIQGVEPMPVIYIDGEGYYKVWPEHEFWTMLGHAPKPKTDYEKARFDFLHGMTMKYGFVNSLSFAVRHYYKRKKKSWQS